MFIDSQFTWDYDSQMTEKYFAEYIGIKVKQFRETLLLHMGNVKKSLAERTRHKNKCGGTKSYEHITSSSSGTYITHAVDADIRLVNDQVPFAEVQLTTQHNVLANEQQHTEQSEPIYDTYLLGKVNSNTTPDSTNMCHRGGEIDQDAEQYKVKSPLFKVELDAPEFCEFFEINDLKAQLQAKTTLICNLKNQIKSVKEASNEAKVKNDIDVIETINIELEHSVAKLLAANEQLHKENEHLKQTYKELYDSIKKTRVQNKDISDSLISQINQKSVENADLKAQIQEKVFANAALKNELRKLKGNSVDTKFTKSSILGKPVLQPPRNQSGVRQHNAFKSERPNVSKPRFASQVDVNNVLSKPVTPHYLPKVREYVLAKPHYVIAPGSDRNSQEEPYGSNDMAHNHYLEEVRKKTQEINRNSKPSVMHTTSLQNTTNGSKPNPRSNNQLSRSLPVSKSSGGMLNVVSLVDHSRKSSSFTDSKHFVCSTCHKCVFNANHDNCITKFLKEVNSHAKVQSPKTRNNNKPVVPKSHTQKPGRQIVIGQMFSLNKSSAMHEKPHTPRSCLRWKPTGRIFKTVGLRWIPTGKMFTDSTTNVDCEPLNGSNDDIANPYECDQTLYFSAGLALQRHMASADNTSGPIVTKESYSTTCLMVFGGKLLEKMFTVNQPKVDSDPPIVSNGLSLTHMECVLTLMLARSLINDVVVHQCLSDGGEMAMIIEAVGPLDGWLGGGGGGWDGEDGMGGEGGGRRERKGSGGEKRRGCDEGMSGGGWERRRGGAVGGDEEDGVRGGWDRGIGRGEGMGGREMEGGDGGGRMEKRDVGEGGGGGREGVGKEGEGMAGGWRMVAGWVVWGMGWRGDCDVRSTRGEGMEGKRREGGGGGIGGGTRRGGGVGGGQERGVRSGGSRERESGKAGRDRGRGVAGRVEGERNGMGLALQRQMAPADNTLGPYFNPSPSVVQPVLVAGVQEPIVSTGTPSSTRIDQDTPSTSTSQTTQEEQSYVIPTSVEEDNYGIKVAHMDNDLLVSTRLQLQTEALFCYYDALPSSSEHKSYKDALTESCWIDAMKSSISLNIWRFGSLQIKEQKENGVVELYFVNTKFQLADIFSKPLGQEKLEFLMKNVGMQSMSPETLKKLADETEELWWGKLLKLLKDEKACLATKFNNFLKVQVKDLVLLQRFPIQSMVDVPIHQEDLAIQRTPLIDPVISMVTEKTSSTPTPPTTQAHVQMCSTSCWKDISRGV
ncbi:hypothetical protein Tco_0449004 [Tanacetum coccineum]